MGGDFHRQAFILKSRRKGSWQTQSISISILTFFMHVYGGLAGSEDDFSDHFTTCSQMLY